MLPDHCKNGVTFLFRYSSRHQPAKHDSVAGMQSDGFVTNFKFNLRFGFFCIAKFLHNLRDVFRANVSIRAAALTIYEEKSVKSKSAKCETKRKEKEAECLMKKIGMPISWRLIY